MNTRSAHWEMIDPTIQRTLASPRLEDILGRFYHHFHVRGNTLVLIPGSRNATAPPLGVTTWQISEIVEAMRTCLAAHVLDDLAFELDVIRVCVAVRGAGEVHLILKREPALPSPDSRR